MQFVTLKFHPHLQQYTRGLPEHTISISSLDEIRLCLENMFPELGKFILRMKSGAQRRQNLALVNKNKRVLGHEDYVLNRLTSDDTEFHVVPLLIGAGGKSGMTSILIGAAFIALAVETGGTALMDTPLIAGTTMTLGSIAMSIGVRMVLSGVMAMVMKPPKPDMTGQQTTDTEARMENKIFNGLQNTTKSNTPVAMVYGRTRLGGQFVSGEIRTFDHGKNETVNVNLLFPTGAG